VATVSTQFAVPCTQDRAILAIQDTIDRFGWRVLEVSASRMVVTCPPLNSMQVTNFPKLTANLRESGISTRLAVSVSMVGPLLGNKKNLSGLMGQFVNSVSLRVQTNSIAINPTVAVGEGQGGPSPSSSRENAGRPSQTAGYAVYVEAAHGGRTHHHAE
jgi:hypothetical protein